MLKLREIMTTDVATVTPDTTLRDAAELFSRRHVSGAPVVRDGGIVGVVSTSDLLSFLASHGGVPTEEGMEPPSAEYPTVEKTEPPPAPDAYYTELWTSVGEEGIESAPGMEGPEWHLLDQHTVEEVMSRKLWALTPDDDVTVAASLMDKSGIHRVIVADEGKLVGVVTVSDIARAVADRELRSRTYVFTRQPELDERGTE